MRLQEIVCRGVERERRDARLLIEGHDQHDPDCIREIRDVYRRARKGEAKAVLQLQFLDEAGFSCFHCAPLSACELVDLAAG